MKESIFPSFEEGLPRRFKNITLPTEDRRGGGRFYERGCQEKILPVDGPPVQVVYLAASHTSVVSALMSGSTTQFVLAHHCVSVLIEKLKSVRSFDVADHGSI